MLPGCKAPPQVLCDSGNGSSCLFLGGPSASRHPAAESSVLCTPACAGALGEDGGISPLFHLSTGTGHAELTECGRLPELRPRGITNQWLQTTKMHALRSGSQESKIKVSQGQGRAPSESSGGGSLLPLPALAAPGGPWLLAASSRPLPPSSHPAPVRPHLDLITPAKTRFAHTVTVNRTQFNPPQAGGETWVTGRPVPPGQGTWPPRPQFAICDLSGALSCGPSGPAP